MELPILIDAGVSLPDSGGGRSAGGCGSSPDALAHLPDPVRARVRDHPCYSEQAHHYFARMHVAVAPACKDRKSVV